MVKNLDKKRARIAYCYQGLGCQQSSIGGYMAPHTSFGLNLLFVFDQQK